MALKRNQVIACSRWILNKNSCFWIFLTQNSKLKKKIEEKKVYRWDSQTYLRMAFSRIVFIYVCVPVRVILSAFESMWKMLLSLSCIFKWYTFCFQRIRHKEIKRQKKYREKKKLNVEKKSDRNIHSLSEWVNATSKRMQNKNK